MITICIIVMISLIILIMSSQPAGQLDRPCPHLAQLGPQLLQSTSRKEPLRFDSFRFRNFRKLIGSVRFGSERSFSWFDAVRPALFGRVVARSDSVRSGSAVSSGRFRNSRVWFGSAGSVRFLIPSCLRI